MNEIALKTLGEHITRLRLARNLRQAELAYEAGISARTLQRMEAGEVVKTDGLLKVLAHLGRLDDMLRAIATPTVSPYELARSGSTRSASDPPRVRASKGQRSRKKSSSTRNSPGSIQWPEDRE